MNAREALSGDFQAQYLARRGLNAAAPKATRLS
jgi:hypothetical protein